MFLEDSSDNKKEITTKKQKICASMPTGKSHNNVLLSNLKIVVPLSAKKEKSNKDEQHDSISIDGKENILGFRNGNKEKKDEAIADIIIKIINIPCMKRMSH